MNAWLRRSVLPVALLAVVLGQIACDDPPSEPVKHTKEVFSSSEPGCLWTICVTVDATTGTAVVSVTGVDKSVTPNVAKTPDKVLFTQYPSGTDDEIIGGDGTVVVDPDTDSGGFVISHGHKTTRTTMRLDD